MNGISQITTHLVREIGRPSTLKNELLALRPGKALVISAETISEKSNQQSRACETARALGIRVRTTRVTGGIVVQLAEVEPA